MQNLASLLCGRISTDFMHNKKQNPSDTFPKDFLFGAATSSYQTEGNNHNSDWFEWEKKRGLTPCGPACNSWNCFEDDINLLKDFGLQAYRISLEWSRIFESPTKVNYKVLEHYKKILASLKENNIKTFVTLQHHTLPKWLTKGWENPDIEKLFEKYAKVAAKSLHKYVDAWLPINEPAVNNAFGYFMKIFPPGKSSHIATIKVARNQIKTHFRAYHALKEISPKIPVGFVKQLLLLKPYRNIYSDRFLCSYYDYAFNGAYLNTFKNNRLPFSFTKLAGLSESIDFWALNYYTHKWVSFKFPKKRQHNYDKSIETTQSGWEWNPEGLQTAIKRLWNIKQKPIYITENGIGTSEDSKRKLYIYLHLKSVLETLRENIDVKGYFYWSLLDNFEWNHGYKQNFGLADVNRETFARLPRSSGYYLGEIAKRKTLINY